MGGLITAGLVLGVKDNFMKLVADAMAYSQSLHDLSG